VSLGSTAIKFHGKEEEEKVKGMYTVGAIVVYVEKFSNGLVKKVSVVHGEIIKRDKIDISCVWKSLNIGTYALVDAKLYMDFVKNVCALIKQVMVKYTHVIFILNETDSFVKTFIKTRRYRKQYRNFRGVSYHAYSKRRSTYNSVEKTLDLFSYPIFPVENVEAYALLEYYLNKRGRTDGTIDSL